MPTDDFFADLTWTCHICRRERPDAKIGVAKHQHPLGIGCNVRYCTDSPLCALAALDYCHMGKPEEHTL